MKISVLRMFLFLNVLWAINLGLRVRDVGSSELLAFLFVTIVLNWIVTRRGNTLRILERSVDWKMFLPVLAIVGYLFYTR